MKTQLLLLLLPALAIVGAPSDASANLDVDGVLSATTIKADAVGTLRTRTVTLHNHKPQSDADSTSSDGAPEIAFVTYELTGSDEAITAPFVWEDPDTGARSFSAAIDLEDDAIGQTYTIVTTWYDALANALGSVQEAIVVQGRGTAPVSLEVLNPPNEAGDVVLVKNDLVQVDFSVLCDFPWLVADCDAQKAATSKKDQIQLMTGSGDVVSKTKRGQDLDGLTLLKAKTLAAEPLVVGYLRTDSDTVTDTAGTTISVVADPTTVLLKAQVAALEAQVAALQTQLDDHELVTEDIWSTFQSSLETNTAGIADLGAIIGGELPPAADGTPTTYYESLADLELSIGELDVIRPKVITNETKIATNAAAIVELGPSIANNSGLIQANTLKLGDLDARLDLREQYVHVQDGRIETNANGIATNTAAIADLGASRADYRDLLGDQSKQLVDGQNTTMTFAPWGFTLEGKPVGEYFSMSADGSVIDTGYRHLTDVVVTDLASVNPDIVEVALTLTANQPGLIFGDGTTVTFPDITFGVPGTVVKLFSFDEGDPTGFRLIGTGNINDQGAVFATVTGDFEIK